jgi:hypothetical protein
MTMSHAPFGDMKHEASILPNRATNPSWVTFNVSHFEGETGAGSAIVFRQTVL